MRALCLTLLLSFSLSAWADPHQRLWHAAGWPQQSRHFAAALTAAQQQYRDSLPPAIYNALVSNSNRRFEPAAMQQRGLQALRSRLEDPQPAIAFFDSPLGRRIVAAEVAATSPEQLRRNAQGLPAQEISATRQLLIRHLAQALPAREAAAEVSLALAGVAADSLSQMVPGLLGSGPSKELIDGQRARLIQRLDGNVDDTLAHIYRELSDPELDEFVQFAESAQGRAYYREALAALRAALAVTPHSAPNSAETTRPALSVGVPAAALTP